MWSEVDGQITEKARIWTAKEFSEWLRHLAPSLDGEPKPKDETQRDSRRLALSLGFNGMTNVVGRLTPEVAEKLHAALSAASRPNAAGEVRLKSQRTPDALEHVLDCLLASGRLPTEAAEKPQLRIGFDLDQISEAAQRAEEIRRQPVAWAALTDQQRADRIHQALAEADGAVAPASGRPRYY